MVRFGFLATMLLAIIAPACVRPDEPGKKSIELRSELAVGGMTLAESDKPVHFLRLTGEVDKNGEGTGTLELDPNAPKYDEFGFMRLEQTLPLVKLECTVKLVKKTKLMLPESGRVAAPLVEVEWLRFEIQGPKITSKLFLAREAKYDAWARFLVEEKDKVRYALTLRTPPPPEPCHPGCFPAGTPVATPDGPRAVDRIRKGDRVTTVSPDGKTSSEKVASIFVTRNRLIEVRTEAGILVTTETQPLALADGGLCAAGELKAGARLWRWNGNERRAVAVRSVSTTGREEPVYNLVVGDKAIFIADGYLVRSKPPAVVEP